MKSNTINQKEINKFSKIAKEWWDPEGKFAPLHRFNPIRIKYIKDSIINHYKIKTKNKPFKNLNILDIGCGGGLLSEPMSILGANVTGIDPSEKNIKVAKLHSKKNRLKINDEVLIPVLCWSTSLWPLVQFGLKPKFVDIDRGSLNLSIDQLKKKITKKNQSNNGSTYFR